MLTAERTSGLSATRFAREIRVAASLQQANIVPLLSTGDADGLPWFTMPYVEGESLRKGLEARPPRRTGEGINILADVARALDYAHALGVVHRDIKPDNVLLSHGAAVVTDFGIANAIAAAQTESNEGTLTQVGSALGTPAYMAPEQAAGESGVDARADIYAWGCLGYEIFAGSPPFRGASARELMRAHITTLPTPLADRAPATPPAISALIMRCLEKDQADRPQSAAELLVLLEAARTTADHAWAPLRGRPAFDRLIVPPGPLPSGAPRAFM